MDASIVVIGVVLSQNHHPIAFFSKKMSPRMCASSTYIRELYPITEAVKKWRQYLLGGTFKIYTNHKSLKGLINQAIQTPEQQKWLTKLVGYSYEIIYKPGKKNVVADALSRIEEEPTIPIFAAISAPSCSITSQLQQFFAHKPAGQQMMNKLQTDYNMQLKFTMKSGLLYFKDRIFVPTKSCLIPSILEEFHSSPVGGHSSIKATLGRLSTLFYWPGMHADVKNFIRKCDVCQYSKYDPHFPYGLLQPLPIPNQVWEDISMDFITNLPPSANRTVIWVVVDRLSKFAHFVALPTSFSAQQLASVFVSEIYRLHGVSKTIVSDRDKLSISKFWKELFQRLGTTLAYSSSYHPQTDDQTEVLNRCLETYLLCFVSEEPQQWTKFLPLAELWYNSSYHSTIGMSPFEALYGRVPPSVLTYVPGSSKVAFLDELLTEKHEILKLLKFNLTRARHRMTQQANMKRMDKSFQVGQWVYLKLQPYRQISVKQRASQKLAKRYYGPFCILRKIGSVAYELELPPSARIHPVFHVSLLKLCHGQPTIQVTPLPAAQSDLEEISPPLEVLAHHAASDSKSDSMEFSVKKGGQDSFEAT